MPRKAPSLPIMPIMPLTCETSGQSSGTFCIPSLVSHRLWALWALWANSALLWACDRTGSPLDYGHHGHYGQTRRFYGHESGPIHEGQSIPLTAAAARAGSVTRHGSAQLSLSPFCSRVAPFFCSGCRNLLEESHLPARTTAMLPAAAAAAAAAALPQARMTVRSQTSEILRDAASRTRWHAGWSMV